MIEYTNIATKNNKRCPLGKVLLFVIHLISMNLTRKFGHCLILIEINNTALKKYKNKTILSRALFIGKI